MEWKDDDDDDDDDCVEMDEQALHSTISSEWMEMDEATRMEIVKQENFDELNSTT